MDHIPIHSRSPVTLVTGAAGFIGASLVRRLLEEPGGAVVGVDNLNDYYDPALKRWRLARLEEAAAASGRPFRFHRADVADARAVEEIFRACRPRVVVHLAAQAGVRHSITAPDAYIQTNLVGFYNILQGCRGLGEDLEHLVYASSSSVYGGNRKVPFSTADPTDAPVSLYAATKKSGELLAHAYASLFGIPATGLRFFTVYGPAGRPDMAYYAFTEKLLRGETIRLFNYGCCERDFTYVDDIVEGLVRVIGRPPRGGIDAPHAIYNIGGSRPVKLTDFVEILAQELIRAELLPRSFDLAAHQQLAPMQPGDVPVTWADTQELERDFGFRPTTDLRTGLRRFVQWYRAYSGQDRSTDRGEG